MILMTCCRKERKITKTTIELDLQHIVWIGRKRGNNNENFLGDKKTKRSTLRLRSYTEIRKL